MIEPDPPPDLAESKMSRAKLPNPKNLPQFATVIALDPGETTGWSLWNIYPEALDDPKEKILNNIHTWTHGQVDCIEQFEAISSDPPEMLINGADPIVQVKEAEAIGVAELVGLLRSWEGAAVVIESFILMQQRMDDALLSPVRITAALSQWLWQQRRTYYLQQPSYAKTTVTDARLKEWGIYQRSGGMKHARDADRHAITFLRRCKADPMFRARAFPHLYELPKKKAKS